MDWASHMRRILVQLGEDVVYTHGAGSPATIRGVFFMPYQAGELGLVGVSGSNPHFAGMTADLASAAREDTILRGGVTYAVRNPRVDDPSGLTVLELRKA